MNIIGHSIFGNYYLGTYPSDLIIDPEKHGECSIVNIDSSRGKGIHWLAIYNDCGDTYVFDTYNRDYKTLSPYFKNKKWIQPEHEIFESVYGSDCGQQCLSFLVCVKKFGCPLFFETYKI